MSGRGAIESVRRALFVATGLAVPLYAFPVIKALGRSVDLATVFAALFVASSLASHRKSSAASSSWLAAAVVVPALVLIPPRPSLFDPSRFLVSYGHWLLLIAFFFSSSLHASEAARTRVALWNVGAGTFVALFALYQVVGTPRHWPRTGPTLVPFQREPLRITWIGGASQEGSYTRPSSVFLEPSWMGGYLSWVLVLWLAAVLAVPRETRRRAPRPFAAAALTLIVLAIAASVSWGAYVDFGVAAGACLILLGSVRKFSARDKSIALAAAALVVTLAALSPPGRRVVAAVSERWEKLTETSLRENATQAQQQDSSWLRVRNLAYTSRLFRAHPVRGIGLGQFADYAKSGEPSQSTFEDPWCGWVAIAAEMGVLGPPVLLGALLLVLGRWWRNGSGGFVVPALLAVTFVQQFHTASFLDLWWWYPVSVASALCGTAPLRRVTLGSSTVSEKEQA